MRQLGLLVGAAMDTLQGAGEWENSTDEIAIQLVWTESKSWLVYLMYRTVMRAEPWVFHGGFSRSCGKCTPLQSKTIRNSRVLGYGQLNGHVASIVLYFKMRFWRRSFVPERYWKGRKCICEIQWWQAWSLWIARNFAKKNFVLNKTLLKPLGYAISAREAIYLLKSIFLNKEVENLQPWWISYPSWVVNH